MKTRLFYGAFTLGGGVLLARSIEYLSQGEAVLVILIWTPAFGIAQFWLLRCPHCGSLAIRIPAGPYVPWNGNHCRYCQHEYQPRPRFATALRAHRGSAASLRHSPAFLPRSKSSAPPRSTFASRIKEPSSHSGFVQLVGGPYSTPKTVTKSPWASPWLLSLARISPRLGFPPTIAVGTHGFRYLQAREHSTRVPIDPEARPSPIEAEVTPNLLLQRTPKSITLFACAGSPPVFVAAQLGRSRT